MPGSMKKSKKAQRRAFFLSLCPCADTKEMCPGGETGKRKGLKIPRSQELAGSTPAPGTTAVVSCCPMFSHKDMGLFL